MQTRSGAPFSPWHSKLGVPLHAPADFLLHRRMRVAFQAQEERLAALATDPGADPDDPTVMPPLSLPETATVLAPPPSSFPSLAADAAALPRPQPQAGTDYDDTVSKAQFHRRKHRAETRRRKRASTQDPAMNRPMKNAAAKNAVAVLVQPPESDLPCIRPASAPGEDLDGPVAPNFGQPIISPMSLVMEDQPHVAKSAFIGILTEPTEAELAARSRADFEAMGFGYHQWDGKYVPSIIPSAFLTDSLATGRTLLFSTAQANTLLLCVRQSQPGITISLTVS